MKKLITIGIVVAVLVGGIFGGTVLADRPADKPPIGQPAIMMDSGSGNLTIGYNTFLNPQFVSPEYEQTRHISVTLYVDSCEFDSGDLLQVRTYFRNSDGALAYNVPILEFTDSDIYPVTVEFDATQWDIVGYHDDAGDVFQAYFSYTTIYPAT